ncbi:hypothetical protein L596_023403 [Steinernema carpocapsae]|uniref:Uncharacterized protein n=1 Tax=Steinernema carpocapsae TaxID=34508 RepID=A0A4U5MDK6_STECR|nr:hypothetical protein L596_023403 [Steinernema carpocapsae]
MQTPSKWNNEPRRTYTREVPTDALPDRTYSPSMSSVSPQSSHEYRTSTLESNISLGSTKSYHDYRVTAIHDKPDPGKLTDFIPEVERGAINKVSYLDGHNSNQYSDQPKLIRNYNYNIVKSNFDIPPTQPSHNNNNNAAAKEKIHKWVNSSSLPREARNHAQHEDNVDDDTQPGRSFLRKHLRQVNPLLEDERSSNQIPKESNRDGQYANIRDFQRRQPSPAVKDRRSTRFHRRWPSN